MGANNGTGNVNSLALAGKGPVTTKLDTTPPGVIDALILHLDFSLISAGATFNLDVDPTLGEGGDDLDALMNALFSSMSYFLDGATIVFDGFTPAQWRTEVLKKTLLDIEFLSGGGVAANGFAVPVSTGVAAPMYIDIPIPLALPAERIADGALFAQGSDRVRKGTLITNYQAPASAALKNGTADISAVAAYVYAVGHVGDPGQIGHSYRVERLLNERNPFSVPPGVRIDLWDESPVWTNAVPAQGYSVRGQEDLVLIGPKALAERYRRDICPAGGGVAFAAASRGTPLISMPRGSRAGDMPAASPATVSAVGVASFNARQTYVVQAPSMVVADVAATAAGGNSAPVATVHPALPSVQPGQAITADAKAWLPTVYRPAVGAPPASKVHANGTAAARSAASPLTSFMSRFRRG